MPAAYLLRRRLIAALVVVLVCVSLAARAQSPKQEQAITPADWPMYNHDLSGWRFNPAEKTLGPTNVGKLVEKWRFPAANSKETIGVVHATPTVVAGEVYFGTATYPAFYKLAPDGTVRWIYRNPTRKAVLPPAAGAPVTEKLRGAATDGGIFSSALVVDGAVYFADIGGCMYCLDAETGKERWKVDSRASTFPGAHWFNVLMASPILVDGKVVFGGGTLEQLVAGTLLYSGSTGRGFLVALDPKTGNLIWKYDVGPKPEKFNPPVVVEDEWGKYSFSSGPATSSVWSTPSYDPETNTLFFGTDVNTAPRRPTKDNPNLHTEDSCAIVALDAGTGKRKWNTQINPGDVWTNTMRAYDPKTGLYKDGAVGDTPKLFTIDVDGELTKVVGAGCKNGGFFILRADNGKLVKHTPVYDGAPTHPPAKHDPRILALPSPVGGLQTGCATDGRTLFTNGIDAVRLCTQTSSRAKAQVPTGGRVTATSVDLAVERWRHERPKIPAMGGTPEKPMYNDVGDVVASGIAVGNHVAYFTTVGSGKLVALDTSTGQVLKEIEIGPVFAGPSLSRGRVYVGGGNTLFTPTESECFFPKKNTGCVRCFGLPDDEESHKTEKRVNRSDFKLPEDVTFRTADILSEGTRMAAEVFAPKKANDDKLPTIVMSHGWGGTAANLRPDAIRFAQAGYLVVAFDYRGWGKSDARIIAVAKPEKKDGKLIAEVKEVRQVVDPIEQTTDIMNAINWVVGEKQCDSKRLGLWGSSMSGGYVVYVAARDPRVKAFVSQVGSMDGRWVLSERLRQYTFEQGTARTNGKIGYPKPGEKFGTLTGAPVIEKFIGFAPIEDIGRCKSCAKLFIIAEKEELFDNKEHAILAHDRASGVKKLVTIKGIKHYGVYNEARDQAEKEAIAWFDEYLKP
ncbi:MAG TPA: alpha/beta fold hydrolase [Gemmataceae bacterium]|jgi:outer membrane protein assembly factor BamB/dienelactone hydrolase